MLVIIDSNYIAYVSAFALSQGLIYRGNRTEVIFGFLKQITSIAIKFQPDQIAFCWDSRTSKRKEALPEYKENRKKDRTEEEKESLIPVYAQFDEIKGVVLPMLGFNNVFMVDGYESDDIIANIVSGKDPQKTIVITSDNDLLQLLDHCSLYSVTKKQSTNKEIFYREYGIAPSEWAMVKAIAGCGTDNVPGVKGVGEKTAIAYLKGESKGKKKFDIEQSSDIIDRNLPLVKLPFQGCPGPRLRNNNLSTAKFQTVCDKYGMESLLTPKQIFEWTSIIARVT
jgi:5'-3' exonuclease